GMAGVGICIERFHYILVKSSKGRDLFLAKFAMSIKDKKYEEAINCCLENSKYPVATVMKAIVSNRSKGKEGMIAASDSAFLMEAPRVNRYLALLGTFANVLTLTGLMGTIFGLIITFDAVANKPAAERPAAMANGISVAMGTTLVALLGAIPIMGVQGFLLLLSERVIQEMEEKGLTMIHHLASEA
ncbi:MAG: MotA/TolQ/ExbB proton channel family protein, partial [Fibromonadales bacterium]|nr:MotA/TolQ/ExbB proton channel family protein [Fibromonadales bacterium]